MSGGDRAEWMNILPDGISCRQPADTELQSSGLQTKNSLENLKLLGASEGGGGGGGFVYSQTSRSIDSSV